MQPLTVTSGYLRRLEFTREHFGQRVADSITRAELRFGVLKLSDAKRKSALTVQIEQVLDLFKVRTLDFDIAASDKLAEIAARCEQAGKAAVAPDAYIAACAAARGFAVATRNVRHFEPTGVRVINPWK